MRCSPAKHDCTLADVSADEKAAAGTLQESIEADAELLAAVERHRGGESMLAVCVRFARARPGSHAKAFAFLSEDMKWRDAQGMLSLTQMSLQEVLVSGECSRAVVDAPALVGAFCAEFPHGHLGFDWQGRPVIYKDYGKVKFWELAKIGIRVETILRHHKWFNERCLDTVGQKGQWVMILNLKGVSLAQCVARSHLNYALGLATTEAVHYPERLGQIFIVNAPHAFAGAFKLIMSRVDERTRKKVQLFGERDDWHSPVAQCMNTRILPEALGGETILPFSQNSSHPSYTTMSYSGCDSLLPVTTKVIVRPSKCAKRLRVLSCYLCAVVLLVLTCFGMKIAGSWRVKQG